MLSTRFLSCLLLIACLPACSDDELPVAPPEAEPAVVDNQHHYVRETPYPKLTNQLFLNPPPLIVPEQEGQEGKVQFMLSPDPGFAEEATVESKPVAWRMYNPHRVLETGRWHWRYRLVEPDGTVGRWSETYRFDITADIPQFVTPDYRTFSRNLPAGHPRLYCFLHDKIEQARKAVPSHPEYPSLTSRADIALKTDYSRISAHYDESGALVRGITWLYQAYYLTGQKLYEDKLLEIFRYMVQQPPTHQQLFDDNFTSTAIALAYMKIYDMFYDRLPEADRDIVEDILMRVLRHYSKNHVGGQENVIFNSHFWQQNMRVLLQCAFMLYDKPEYADEACPLLEYYYEIWTARAPASGYNRDGSWHNGSHYFSANTKTLFYVPSLFSHITGTDFFRHPWFRNAGKSMLYTWPAGSRNCGFGDGYEKGDYPGRQRVSFADFLARELGDGYAAWYATQCMDEVLSDYELRLYRMSTDRTYTATPPTDLDLLLWHKDTGEVMMHSDLGNAEGNLSVSFRSSRYGCTQHTCADQNSFNILYKGADAFRSTGYYTSYASPHHIMSAKHTRAHNSILVNGIGQAFTPDAYGNVVRAIGTDHLGYCLGDASRAYRGISHLNEWIRNFKAAGISQTPENGFGATPLTRYRRHLWMLPPDVVVVYDELEASEPVRWDWLLHSPVEFSLGADARDAAPTITTVNRTAHYATAVTLYSDEKYDISYTDQFAVPQPGYPNQWHLNATVADSEATRFLAVIRLSEQGVQPLPVERSGSDFKVGGWNITAELDSSRPPSVTITHDVYPTLFSYGCGEVSCPTGIYRRKTPFSSVVYDTYHGNSRIWEEVDYRTLSTRAATSH